MTSAQASGLGIDNLRMQGEISVLACRYCFRNSTCITQQETRVVSSLRRAVGLRNAADPLRARLIETPARDMLYTYPEVKRAIDQLGSKL